MSAEPREDRHDDTGRSPKLAAKVAFLLRGAFPEPPEAIETHMSWVFLTADHAYKLKKPIHNRFLDYRRVDARKLDCEAEIRLNEPLAPGTYLGTIPMTSDATGRLALDGPGEAIDWLVVMRRLAEDSLLDRRALAGNVDASELEVLATRLVAFYRVTEAWPTSPDAYRARLLDLLESDRHELLRTDHVLDEERIRGLTDALETAVETHDALAERAGSVVDGHGDLRPEHILLGPDPLIIDRITFSRDLRLVDPLHDLALLAVECEWLGAMDLAEDIIGAYEEQAGFAAPTATMALYRSLRAVTRAHLSIAHLRDSDHDAQKWLDRTDEYVSIAERHIRRFHVEARGGAGSGVQLE